MLLVSLIFYLMYEAPEEKQNFTMVMELLRAGDVHENEVTFTKDVESHQETIIHLIWTEHKTVTHTKLHININHKTANEMVEQYNFNQE